jgi:hypothetical protein
LFLAFLPRTLTTLIRKLIIIFSTSNFLFFLSLAVSPAVIPNHVAPFGVPEQANIRESTRVFELSVEASRQLTVSDQHR